MIDDVHSRDQKAPFEFVANPASLAAEAGESDLVVHLPSGVLRKQMLFRCFASALRFPDYFGRNWDAFRDCLFDLSWLNPTPHRILIIHDDLPFVPGKRDLAIYLSILAECHSELGQHTFRIVFPEVHARAITTQVKWRG